MKNETVLLVAVVGVIVVGGGLLAYKLISKNQIQNAYVPLGANVGTLNAAANVAHEVIPALSNFFGGGSYGYGQFGSAGFSDQQF